MRTRLFRALTAVTTSHPWAVLAVTAVITVLMAVAASRLTVEMTWTSMLPDSEPVVKEYQRILDRFDGALNTVVVAIEGPDRDGLRATAADVERALLPLVNDTHLRRITWKAPTNFIARHGMMLSDTNDLEDLQVLAADRNLVPFLFAYNSILGKTIVGGEDELTTKERSVVSSLDALDAWLADLAGVCAGEDIDTARMHRTIRRFWLGEEEFVSSDGRMLLMTLQPWAPIDSIAETVALADTLDALIAPVKKAHPGQRIRLTGMHMVARDEMKTGTEDAGLSTIVAFVLIIVLLAFSLRMRSAPLLAGTVLVVGVIWDVGLAGLVIGRLNMLTVFCTVYLIGLGVDFSIHYLHGYAEQRARGLGPSAAVGAAFETVGSGILTGALTTAIAFLSLMFTDFDVFRELGFISGVGVLMCVAAAFIVLPSLLVLKDHRAAAKGKDTAPPPESVSFGWLARWASLVTRGAPVVLALTVLATVAAGWFGWTRTWFDGNMMNMEAKGLESVELQDDIVEAFQLSNNTSLFTVPDLDSAYRVTRYLEKQRPVGMVESPSQVCPPPRVQQYRRSYVERIRALTASPDASVPADPAAFKAEIENLEANVIETSQMAYQSLLDRIVRRADRMTGLDSTGERVSEGVFGPIITMLDSLPDSTARRRLEAYQAVFTPLSRTILHGMADTQTVTWDMVPESVAERLVSRGGDEYLVSVYPRNNTWDELLDSPFLRLMRRVAPHGTGMVPFMEVLYRRGKAEGRNAMLYALIAITILLLLDFRSLRFAVLAMVPLLVAVIWLAGGMGLLGIPFTIMNVMGIPLILGIGIDDGVHLCHRFRRERGATIPVVVGGVGKAVFLTSATTMLAFGSLLFARMRGNVSLGGALFAGVGLCFVMTVTVLPVLLRLAGGKKRRGPPRAEGQNTESSGSTAEKLTVPSVTE